MASLTIRNLNDDLKASLRLQAARHGCSMEQEAREILRRAVMPAANEPGFAQRIRQRFAALEMEALPVPDRRLTRTPPAPEA